MPINTLIQPFSWIINWKNENQQSYKSHIILICDIWDFRFPICTTGFIRKEISLSWCDVMKERCLRWSFEHGGVSAPHRKDTGARSTWQDSFGVEGGVFVSQTCLTLSYAASIIFPPRRNNNSGSISGFWAPRFYHSRSCHFDRRPGFSGRSGEISLFLGDTQKNRCLN